MPAEARKRSAAEDVLAVLAQPGGEARWAEDARAKARAAFRAMGAPGPRDEYWRYTDPASLTVQPAPAAAVLAVEEAPVFGALGAIEIVFQDGVLQTDLATLPQVEGLEIQCLDTVLATDIHWARELFGVREAAGQTPVARPLAALNTACATGGIVLRATGAVGRPVLLRYLHARTDSDAMLHHLVRVEAGASLTVLEAGPAAARFNKVMEVEVGEDAAFHHVRAQGRDHERRAVTHVFARLAARAELRSFTLTVNGRLTRNEVVVDLTGPQGRVHLAGACLGDGEFHQDDTVFVTHGAEDCLSRQVFKKVLKNGATGVFQGKILVKQVAQRTDGYQLSQGLMLDDDSRFLAKPELEIYADDVKCSHGSTVGAVDPVALFYLVSRGVPRAEAQDMLVLAFLDEAVGEIADAGVADDIRARLEGWMLRRRRG